MKKLIGFLPFCALLLFVACAVKSERSEDNAAASALFASNESTITDMPAKVEESNFKTIAMTAKLDNEYYPKGEKNKSIFVYLTVKGNEVEKKQDRTPLNISLVLDRSGSMSGDKLAYSKKAMSFVIDQLQPEDMLSLVQYDDEVDVLQVAEKVTDKKKLHRKIEEIRDNGSTNLCGGLKEGYNQTEKNRSNNYVNRVLLLSDGLANVGITNPKEIAHIAKNHFQEKGIAVSTFGVGADYNEDLMTDIADNGGANYYFIGNPDQIPSIFEKELKGLLSVVAQKVNVKVKFPEKLVRCKKVYGYPHTQENGKVSINLNDLYSGEEKAILLEFEVLEPLQQNVNFTCITDFWDVADKTEHANSKELEVKITDNEDLLKKNEDAEVKEQIVLFRSTEMFDEALRNADKGDYKKAEEQANEAE
ncbi:MAG: vWA domain-containing protein, partial [Bacteroidia bacterium]